MSVLPSDIVGDAYEAYAEIELDMRCDGATKDEAKTAGRYHADMVLENAAKSRGL